MLPIKEQLLVLVDRFIPLIDVVLLVMVQLKPGSIEQESEHPSFLIPIT